MTALEQHRIAWPDKSDEWLFERLDGELKSKVNTIHNLLEENQKLNELMRWRDPEVELPEFNKKDYLDGDYKKYLIRVVEGSISTRRYVTVGWLISANRWNAEMDWVAVIGWRPIE